MKATILHIIEILKRSNVSALVLTAIILSLLFLTIIRVETGLSNAETLLCTFIPIIAMAGGAMSILMRHHFRLTAIDCIVIIWYLFAMGRFWIDDTYPTCGFAVKFTLALLLYASLRLLMSSGKRIGDYIFLSLIFLSLIEAFIGYLQLLSGTSRHHLYPVTGSFLNPGPYSVYLAIGLVLILALKKKLTLSNIETKNPDFTSSFLCKDYCLKHMRHVEILSDIFFMIIVVPFVLTMSRAAFLAVAVCIFILYHGRIRGWKRWSMIWAMTSVVGLTLYIFKSGSADGRGIINYIGLKCIVYNPWFGNGIGSFFHCYAEETARLCQGGMIDGLKNVDVLDYAFNDLLLVVVEQGVLGLIIVMTLIFAVMYRLWHSNRPLFLGTLTILIFSLFSYPFELLPFQIIAVLIVSFAGNSNGATERTVMVECLENNVLPKLISKNTSTTSGAQCKNKKDYNYGWRNILKIVLAVLIVFLTSDFLFDAVNEKRKAEREYSMMSGISDAAFIKDYYELLPRLDGNKRFLFDFGVMLAKERRYNDSNEMLRRGALISNDPMFLVLQGNNYRNMGAIDKAEQMYLKAWHTMPNRLYPLYRLMMLHKESENMDKGIEYAMSVLAFKEKINSPAVKDMKEQALEIIKQNANLNKISNICE